MWYMSEVVKWINILTTLLAFSSMGVIMLTLSLILMLNNILTHAGGQIPTILGFMASLITLPAAFKIKIYFAKARLDKLKKYNLANYHFVILAVSFVIQALALLMCIVSLARYKTADTSFLEFMKDYKNEESFNIKKYIDNVQFNFECCGQIEYQDWFRTTGCNKSVPFSCCKVLTLDDCRHYALGNTDNCITINTDGCGEKISHFVLSTLITEFILYVFIFVLIILLLKHTKADDVFHIPKSKKKKKWNSFMNCAPNKKKSKASCLASLKPSAMRTLTIKKR